MLLLMTDLVETKKRMYEMLYRLPIGARVLTYDDFPELMEKPTGTWEVDGSRGVSVRSVWWLERI